MLATNVCFRMATTNEGQHLSANLILLWWWEICASEQLQTRTFACACYSWGWTTLFVMVFEYQCLPIYVRQQRLEGKTNCDKWDVSRFVEPTVDLVRCALRVSSCNFALCSKRDASKAPVSQFRSSLGALSSVLGDFLSPRWRLWGRLGAIFGDLRKVSGVQSDFGSVFNRIWPNFGLQNGNKIGSGEASKREAVYDIEFNRFRDGNVGVQESNSCLCWVRYEVHECATMQLKTLSITIVFLILLILLIFSVKYDPICPQPPVINKFIF